MRIARIDLNIIEGLQVAGFGICTLYALFMYAMRKPRDGDMTAAEANAEIIPFGWCVNSNQ
jgi:hypothetical protein